MTMFGVNIPIEIIRRAPRLDTLVDSVLKRSDERKIFSDFLKSTTSDGNTVLSELTRFSLEEAKEMTKLGVKIDQTEIINFALSRLKTARNNNMSEYDLIIHKVVEELEPCFKKLHTSLANGKFDGKLPLGYPDVSKKATSILIGKIKDKHVDLVEPYLVEKILLEKIRLYSREMFYCINKGSGNVACNYLGIRHEMFKLRSADELNTNIIRDAIIKSLSTGEGLTILSPKCLRFSYPYGNRLKIINHTESEAINKKDGSKYLFRDENVYLSRLIQLKSMFEMFGIKTNFILLVMDRDVSDYFPLDGGGIIPAQDLSVCTNDITEYTSAVSKQLGQYGVKVTTFTNFLGPDFLKEFLKRKSDRLAKAKRGSLMRENFIENRVEYYFESKNKIFENAPSKDFSRERVYAELASQQSLDVFNEMYTNYIVVSDDLFNMSSVLGDGKIPAYFADLGKDVGFNVE